MTVEDVNHRSVGSEVVTLSTVNYVHYGVNSNDYFQPSEYGRTYFFSEEDAQMQAANLNLKERI